MRELFAFPNPLNEKAARVVAGTVAVLAIVTLVTQAWWLLVVLAYGFLARVLTGPTLSPLGRLAKDVVAPRLGPAHMVPGPPKRFAQGIGAVVTTTAAVLALVAGETAAAAVLTAMIAVFAVLESVFAYCVGCKVFALLMRAGVVPANVCEACVVEGTRT